jgi:MinD superfamily P-loop ATPase
MTTLEGRLNVGEALAPPVTRVLKKVDSETEVKVFDAPPGTSCPVIEAINDTDFVILVTEPTPFGLNDLELAVGMVKELGLPSGVVINRSDIGDDRVDRYCDEHSVDRLLSIPFERDIAEAYSRGELLIDANLRYREQMIELYRKVCDRVNQ